MAAKPTEQLDRVAIRFCGDSGDGMQLTGTKFTESTALAGNDLSTLPDFPAEIRAPAGTLAGGGVQPGGPQGQYRRRQAGWHGHPEQ
jgi:hypothetical protein